MFKRKLEMRLVKDSNPDSPISLLTPDTAQTFTKMVKDAVVILGVGSVLVIIAGVTANVIGEIVVDNFTN